MTEEMQIYKCNVCGNIVEVLHPGKGKLVCCGQPMELIEERTMDEGREKHVPIIETTDEGILVRVGSVEHPMNEAHHIEWIELITNNGVYRKFLSLGDKPKAAFEVKTGIDNIKARAYCNVHGLWMSK
ncbi:MAG: desulfoferrodoxin [Candidatus Baldrarchaeia archaeon]